jgi:hypothetical protein
MVTSVSQEHTAFIFSVDMDQDTDVPRVYSRITVNKKEERYRKEEGG